MPGFQSNAFQPTGFQADPFVAARAFQVHAFQTNAFQMGGGIHRAGYCHAVFLAETRPMKLEPVLNELDRRSATWLKVKKHLEERITLLRAKNDGDHDERKTARLRGSIAELKYLCNLDSEQPKAAPHDELFD